MTLHCVITILWKYFNVIFQEVILSYNEIKKSGAIALAEAMENKENLEKLELNGKMLQIWSMHQVQTPDQSERWKLWGQKSVREYWEFVKFVLWNRVFLSTRPIVRAIPFKKLLGGVSALNFLDYPAAISENNSDHPAAISAKQVGPPLPYNFILFRVPCSDFF